MTETRTILGIDPGYGRMGFGCLRCSKKDYEALGFGVITTKSKTPFPKRLSHIGADVEDLVNKYEPDIFAVERLYFAKNTTTAMKVAEARGVSILKAADAGIRVVEFTPAQIKKAVTGTGSADKKAMQEMVKRTLGLPRIPKPDDAADALAVALTAGVTSWGLMD